MLRITGIGSAFSIAAALSGHVSALAYVIGGVLIVLGLLPAWLRELIAAGNDLLRLAENYRRFRRREQLPRRSPRLAPRSLRRRRRIPARRRKSRDLVIDEPPYIEHRPKRSA
jgi:hypothetical protein